MGSDRDQGPVTGAESDRRPGLPAGPVLLEQDFDADSLYSLRAAVAAHASATGLDRIRVYDIVSAAHELAANAVRHGAGRGHLRLRSSDGNLYCEVRDHGSQGDGIPSDVPWRIEHGHGLWVVDQVCDQFSVDRRADGTSVTARFAIR
jgi:anti-sigma regulatory factor (Ser/Thr protein kinase)